MMDFTRRDFVRSLVASVVAVSAPLPVGLSESTARDIGTPVEYEWVVHQWKSFLVAIEETKESA